MSSMMSSDILALSIARRRKMKMNQIQHEPPTHTHIPNLSPQAALFNISSCMKRETSSIRRTEASKLSTIQLSPTKYFHRHCIHSPIPPTSSISAIHERCIEICFPAHQTPKIRVQWHNRKWYIVMIAPKASFTI